MIYVAVTLVVRVQALDSANYFKSRSRRDFFSYRIKIIKIERTRSNRYRQGKVQEGAMFVLGDQRSGIVGMLRLRLPLDATRSYGRLE